MSPAATDSAIFASCLQAVCRTLQANEAELSALDRAIGDGDHGANLNRAVNALLEAADELCVLPVSQALERAGLLVVTSVGGASGPLYGSMLMALGRAWPEPPTREAVAEGLVQGVEALGRRGRSTVGEKTMLDVLDPAVRAFRAAAASGSLNEALQSMLNAADAGLERTKPLRATKGRAAYVGERAIGHLDPGAASARLCLHAVASALLGARRGELS
jgi:dihydroxyacetone kinase-like protein